MKKTVSAVILAMLLASMLTLSFEIQSVRAAGQTVYINADGSITPAGVPITTSDNITYTLTGNVSYPTYYGIIIQKNNTVINGNGYTITGNQSGNGLYLAYVSNVTIKNVNVQNFQNGIYLFASSLNIVNNTASKNNNYCGIYLYYSSSDNALVNNTASNNNYCGICLDGSSSTNKVDSNVATSNSYHGIMVYSSSNNFLMGNNASGNTLEGIYVTFSSNTYVGRNNADTNRAGIMLYSANNNTVSRNVATANAFQGIEVDSSSSNLLTGNNASANSQYGISFDSSSLNTVYHNDFMNNSLSQASMYNATEIWDNGYPSGGNYWSDYQTRYPSASEIDSSGIWNTPYAIDSNNTDHYPLMQPFGCSSTLVVCTPNPVTFGSSVTCTATVSGLSPTGTVTWSTSSSTGNFTQYACTLSNGTCSTTYADNFAGSETIAAYYSGDSNNLPDSSSTILTVTSGGSII
jgi:parallel beta-helix repeat protein